MKSEETVDIIQPLVHKPGYHTATRARCGGVEQTAQGLGVHVQVTDQHLSNTSVIISNHWRTSQTIILPPEGAVVAWSRLHRDSCVHVQATDQHLSLKKIDKKIIIKFQVQEPQPRFIIPAFN